MTVKQIVEKSVIFEGIVQSGFGTGEYYVQLPHYFQGFTRFLQKPPFPGTLNVLFTEEDYLKLHKLLQSTNPLVISGKKNADDGNWRIECYCTRLWSIKEDQKVKALLLRFSRPDHEKEIIEFVSTYHLREKFHLEDNSTIRFHLMS
jgi:CTP-dependent riboflavin kinase